VATKICRGQVLTGAREGWLGFAVQRAKIFLGPANGQFLVIKKGWLGGPKKEGKKITKRENEIEDRGLEPRKRACNQGLAETQSKKPEGGGTLNHHLGDKLPYHATPLVGK